MSKKLTGAIKKEIEDLVRKMPRYIMRYPNGDKIPLYNQLVSAEEFRQQLRAEGKPLKDSNGNEIQDNIRYWVGNYMKSDPLKYLIKRIKQHGPKYLTQAYTNYMDEYKHFTELEQKEAFELMQRNKETKES